MHLFDKMKRGVITLFCLLSCSVFAQLQYTGFTSFDSVVGTVNENPKIVGNESGLFAVAWVQNDQLYASVFVNGSWETPIQLTSGAATDQFDICMDGAGNITAGALKQGPTNEIYGYYRPAGISNWSEQVVYNPGDNTLSLLDLSIACTEENAQALFVWADSKIGAGKIQSKYQKNGVLNPAAATSATLVASNPPDVFGSSNPIVKMRPDGTAQAVYLLGDGGSDVLYFNTFNPATNTWGVQSQISGFGMTGPSKFDFDMNDSGNSILVGYGNGEAPLISVQINGAWSDANSMGIGTPEGLRVGIDNNNLVTVAWIDQATQQVFARTTPITSIPSDWDGGLVSLSSGSANSRITLAVSDNGYVFVGWDNTNASNNYESVTAFSGGSFSNVMAIASNTSPATAFIRNNGSVATAWVGTLSPKIVKIAFGIDPIKQLIGADGKKRLLYQKGLYP